MFLIREQLAGVWKHGLQGKSWNVWLGLRSRRIFRMGILTTSEFMHEQNAEYYIEFAAYTATSL